MRLLPHPLGNYPFEVLVKKFFSKASSYTRKKHERKKDQGSERRSAATEKEDPRRILSTEQLLPASPSWDADTREHLLAMYRSHHFDILGSGWVDWGYDADAAGFEGHHFPRVANTSQDEGGAWLTEWLRPTHSERAAEIWGHIQDPSYRAIDWQRDMRSGFRWDASVWGPDQHLIHQGTRGADPKVPMEMCRLQHLPRMALLVADVEENTSPYVQEFRNQVLDFIASNPPGMGMGWSTSMDVGIRLANLLLAYDLFRGLDHEGMLDKRFRSYFLDHVDHHVHFIRNNPEYQEGLTGNHYLFNVAGLLFAGLYLPESEGWEELLEEGVQETVRELFKQFFPGGGNFEGSTAYHRLALEMMGVSAAVILRSKDRLEKLGWDRDISLSKWSLGISGTLRSTTQEPLPASFLERLEKAFLIEELFTQPDERHPQIGDNDSGRFFRLTPVGAFRGASELGSIYRDRPTGIESAKEVSFDEDLLDQTGTLAMFEGWKGSRKKGSYPEKRLIQALIDGNAASPLKGSDGLHVQLTARHQEKVLTYEEESWIPFGEGLAGVDRAVWRGDPEAGFFILKQPPLHIILNAPAGKGIRHTWGHVHNDRGGVEVKFGERELLSDPGTYVYEAIPELRNLFRSTSVHNVPYVRGVEQNRWMAGKKGLFFLRPESRCELLWVEEGAIEVKVRYRGVVHLRMLEVKTDGLRILDRCNRPFDLDLKAEQRSWGYGKRVKNEQVS